MRPVKLILTPANVDPNGIVETSTPAGAGLMPMDGALADLGTAGVFDVGDSDSSGIKGRIIEITSDGADNGVTFSIVGTDPEGAALTEVVTGPATTTVRSTGYFQTISSITISAAGTGNIIIGTSNATNSLCTAVIPLNHYSNYPATLVIMGTTGTFVVDVDQTFDELVTQTSPDVDWMEISTAQSADAVLSFPTDTAPHVPARHARGIRLRMDSYTNTAELSFHILQN